MKYPSTVKTEELLEQIKLQIQLRSEYGAKDVFSITRILEESLAQVLDQLASLPPEEELALKEPDSLEEIRKLRPSGTRSLGVMDSRSYQGKLAGAFLGRMAGCTLGAPVEFWSIVRMEALARENGTPFPPVDYWTFVDNPSGIRYLKSRRDAYTRDGILGVPVDDDVEYTLTGLDVAEKHGLDFTTADVGKTWLERLPMACTAEEIALNNLKKGIPALDAADVDNPYCEWIGADIRCDPWAYMSPAHPERAAELAYRDAYLSHRRQGIYGEMYFAAAISAAFALGDPMKALEAGLTEIPAECALARAVLWALEKSKDIKNYRDARQAVEEKFAGMSPVHTVNNACLTVFGISLGSRDGKVDFTRIISETVAMGMDNDCTAATAGSITGAAIGIEAIPEHWYVPFGDTVYSYSKTCEKYSIKDLFSRFTDLAVKNGCVR